jgi:hypothetical protein
MTLDNVNTALKMMRRKHIKMFDDARTMLHHLNDNKAINDQNGPSHLFITISIAEWKLLWIYNKIMAYNEGDPDLYNSNYTEAQIKSRRRLQSASN